MGPEIVFIFIFAVIFGIFYLYFSTRNKERLALIDKGVDATIFMRGQQDRKPAPFWKILILNIGLLAIGVGVGVLLGAFLNYHFGYDGTWQNRPVNSINGETFYMASIFLCAGAALLIGFKITKNLDKE